MVEDTTIHAMAEPADCEPSGPPSSVEPPPPTRKRFKRRKRRLLAILKALPGGALRLAGLVAAVLIPILFAIELTRHQIEIQPIVVPKSLAEAGYTPEVAALRLHDAIDRLAEEAVSAGGQTLTVAMHGEMPEIVVPTVGLSMSALAAYLRHFFGYSPRTTISGELVLSEQRFSLLLRLDGQMIFRSREVVGADKLDNLWGQAAQAVMLEMSPYLVVLALYDTDQDAAMRLASGIVRRYPPDNENVAWARLMRASQLLDSMQFSAAENEIREVLQQADRVASMWSWAPFANQVSYAEPARFYLGVGLLNRGKTAEGVAELREAVRLDPNDPGAHYALGVGLQQLKETADAKREFAAMEKIYYDIFAKKHGPRTTTAHISLGNGLMDRNQEEGLAQLRSAVELDPDSEYAHRYLCNGLRQARRRDEALAECGNAARMAPRRAENQTTLAELSLERNDIDGAMVAAETALTLAPASPMVHETLGRVYEKAGRMGEAAAHYREAIRLAPESAGFHNSLGNFLSDRTHFAGAADEYRRAIELNPLDAMLRRNLGGVLARQNDLGGAIREYEEAIALYDDQADWHRGLARVLQRKPDIDGAIPECKVAVGLAGGQALWFNDLANLYYEKQAFAAATDCYAAAIALRPLDAVLRGNLAGALAAQNDVYGATRQYNAAIGLAAGDPEWRQKLAELLRRMHDFEGAIQEYKAALKLRPDNALWHNALGNIYFDKDDFAAAADSYWVAVTLAPLDPAIRANLGGALYKQDDLDGALEQVNAAIELDPSNSQYDYYLGLVFIGQNKFGDAASALRAAIALKPDSPQFYRYLAVALENQALSAESDASGLDLLTQACRAVTEGLREAPGDPDLRGELIALAPQLPDSAGCRPQPTSAAQ